MLTNAPIATTFVEDHSVRETFADCLGLTIFDGHLLRAEFCVTRVDRPKQGKKASQHTYPVCRLVLTPDAVQELHEQLNQIASALRVRAEQVPSPTVQ